MHLGHGVSPDMRGGATGRLVGPEAIDLRGRYLVLLTRLLALDLGPRRGYLQLLDTSQRGDEAAALRLQALELLRVFLVHVPAELPPLGPDPKGAPPAALPVLGAGRVAFGEVVKRHVQACVLADFPLRSTDLTPGTPPHTRYVALLECLLETLVGAQSLAVLEPLFVVLREEAHTCLSRINWALQRFVGSLNSAGLLAAFGAAAGHFRDGRLPLDLRVAVLERVGLPLLARMGAPVAQQALDGVAPEALAALKAPMAPMPGLGPSRCAPAPASVAPPLGHPADLSGPRNEALQLRAAYFRLMQGAYGALGAEGLAHLTRAIYGPQAKGSELTKDMMALTERAKAERCRHPKAHPERHGTMGLLGGQPRLPATDGRVLFRYHSAAWCCLAEVIMATQSLSKFYNVFLFKEGRDGDLLWNCLIDPTVTYSFTALTQFSAATSTLAGIRQAAADKPAPSPGPGADESEAEGSEGADSPSPVPRYLGTQYLEGSSLTAELPYMGSFFGATQLVTPAMLANAPRMLEQQQSHQQQPAAPKEGRLEADHLNQLPCMGTLVRVIDKMAALPDAPHPPPPVRQAACHPASTPSEYALPHPPSEYALPHPPSEHALPHPCPAFPGGFRAHRLVAGCANRARVVAGAVLTQPERYHLNAQLLVAKLIVNRPAAFEPYAAHWVEPLIALITSPTNGGKGLHYMARDLCLVLLRWEKAPLPTGPAASRLVEHIMKNIPNEHKARTPSTWPPRLPAWPLCCLTSAWILAGIVKSNLEILKLFVERWRAILAAKRRIVHRYLTFRPPPGGMDAHHDEAMTRTFKGAGLQIMGVLLANGLPPYDIREAAGDFNETRLYEGLVRCIDYDKREVAQPQPQTFRPDCCHPVYEAAGEVCGMALKNLSAPEAGPEAALSRGRLTEALNAQVRRPEEGRPLRPRGRFTRFRRFCLGALGRAQLVQMYSGERYDRFLTTLHMVGLHWQPFLDEYLPRCMELLGRVYGLFLAKALQILAWRLGAVADEPPAAGREGGSQEEAPAPRRAPPPPNAKLEQVRAEFGPTVRPHIGALLSRRDEQVQALAVAVLEKALPKMPPADRTALLDAVFPMLVSNLRGHPSVRCRAAFYSLLKRLYDLLPHGSDDPQAPLLAAIRQHLLEGLLDDAEPIRAGLFEFWDGGGRLAEEPLGRAMDLLSHRMYAPTAERRYLHYAGPLLLALCSRSGDYESPLFDPLTANATWRPLPIEAVASATDATRTGAPAGAVGTPLFHPLHLQQQGVRTPSRPLPPPALRPCPRLPSAPFGFLTSMPSSGFLAHVRVVWSGRAVGGAQILENATQMGLVRATQAASFTATQSALDELNTSTMLFSLGPATLESATLGAGAGSMQIEGLEGPQARRRPLAGDIPAAEQGPLAHVVRRFAARPESSTQSLIIRRQAQLKRSREAYLQRQREGRHTRVVMYRHYRTGELPDIQFKPRELVVPLQALAKRDATFARLLFVSLVRAVYEWACKSQKAATRERTASRLYEHIHFLLQQSAAEGSPHDPAFVGALQGLCLELNFATLDPDTVLLSAARSSNHQAGVLLLERRLEDARADTGPEGDQVRDTVHAHLGHLYKALGEEDVLRGLAHRVARQELTRQAIDTELSGDYNAALLLYHSALERQQGHEQSAFESDTLYAGYLKCYAQLTRWDDLGAQVLDEVAGDPTKFLAEEYRHALLGYFIRSHLYEPQRFEALADFVRQAQARGQLGLVQEHHAAELALVAVAQEEFDRARQYVRTAQGQILDQWAALHPLATHARRCLLQQIQRIGELDEALDFAASCSAQAPEVAKARFLRMVETWAGRWPSTALDGTEVWTDLMSSRTIIIEALVKRFQPILYAVPAPPDEAEPAAGGGSSAVGGAPSLSRAEVEGALFHGRATMLRLVGDCARKQRNFAVAAKYLRLCQAAFKMGLRLGGAAFARAAGVAPATGTAKEDRPMDFGFLRSFVKLHVAKAAALPPGRTQLTALTSLADYLARYPPGKLAREPTKRLAFMRYRGKVLARLATALDALPADLPPGHAARASDHHCLAARMHARCAMGPAAGGSVDAEGHGGEGEATPPAEVLPALTCAQARAQATDRWAEAHQCFRQAAGMVEAAPEQLQEAAKLHVQYGLFCAAWLARLEAAQPAAPAAKAQADECARTLVTSLLRALELGSFLARDRFPKALDTAAEHPTTHALFAAHMATEYPQAVCTSPFRISSEDLDPDSPIVQSLRGLLALPPMDRLVTELERLTHPQLRCKDWLGLIITALKEKNYGRATELRTRMMEDLFDDLDPAKGPTSPLPPPPLASILPAAVWARQCGWAAVGVGDDARGCRQLGFPSGRLADPRTDVAFGKAERSGMVSLFGRAAEFTERNSGTKVLEGIMAAANGMGAKMGAAKKTILEAGGHFPLQELSPWLADYDLTNAAEAIEVPGQYRGGRSQPRPELHAKVAGFDRDLLVLNSMRVPKRLTVRGDDEAERMFLVKGGEDLRLDQRIEQLFAIMNDIFRQDPAAAQRRLHLTDYSPGAAHPLKRIIEERQRPADVPILSPTKGPNFEYDAFVERMAKRNPKAKDLGAPQKVREMNKVARRRDVVDMMTRIAASFKPDHLKRGVMSMASSAESYLLIRNNFVRSLGTASIASYICGIGDRHLDNFLLDQESGRMVLIDFGYAFGTSLGLPAPEMMPFRLTRQFHPDPRAPDRAPDLTHGSDPQLTHRHPWLQTEFCQPLGPEGLLKHTMVHALGALHERREVLLAAMEVFVSEPIVDWTKFLNKDKAMEVGDDVPLPEWYAGQRVDLTRRKLDLHNPRAVMQTELEYSTHWSDRALGAALADVIRGDPERNLRARLGDRCASVGEQVDCLLDQATDDNVIGRAWKGWCSWL
ncbi:putative DNA-dependent protein kinase catalytic subunit [Paratrimastix pyriformis]|uniref:DNA-dependent protein kinase catalytic subunit n=1 Tax=Paratrimastix pyriformis TaxID=342808 RepID=A0ABQ8UT79_9EUKA|nr:putative DNA-dependent protein kinase catalytic subunit [Paratrimastix pyriformis]